MTASRRPAIVEDQAIADAREFSKVLARNWEGGVLVARSVEPGTGGPRTGGKPAGYRKLSFREFGEHAGCDRETVRAYYVAWERAADEGLVSHAGDLSPGQSVDLAAARAGAKTWDDFYRHELLASARRRKRLRELGKKLEEVISRDLEDVASRRQERLGPVTRPGPYVTRDRWQAYAKVNPEWGWRAAETRVSEALWCVGSLIPVSNRKAKRRSALAARLRQAADDIERPVTKADTPAASAERSGPGSVAHNGELSGG